MKCTFSHCSKGGFWFDIEDGGSIMAYWWNAMDAEVNLDETVESLKENADCFQHFKDGELVDEGGW